jgi:hypothetical protein
MIKKYCDGCKKLIKEGDNVEANMIITDRIYVGGSGIHGEMHFHNIDCLQKFIKSYFTREEIK